MDASFIIPILALIVSAGFPQVSFDNQPDDFYAAHCDIVARASPTRGTASCLNASSSATLMAMKRTRSF